MKTVINLGYSVYHSIDTYQDRRTDLCRCCDLYLRDILSDSLSDYFVDMNLINGAIKVQITNHAND